MASFLINDEDPACKRLAPSSNASHSSLKERKRSHRHGESHHGFERSDREQDRSQNHRRNLDKDRSHNREQRSRDSSRDWDRHIRDSTGERRHRHTPKSRSSERSRSRSRERSGRSQSRDRKSKRVSGFDLPPNNPATTPGVALDPGQLAAVLQGTSSVLPGIYPFSGGVFPAAQMQAMTQQAIRQARRVYVGGLPPSANEQDITIFFSQVMAEIGGNTAGPGNAVVHVYINHEKKFAFVEMRTVEEASNAMALNGVMFEGMPLRVGRPTDYNPTMAATLGPSQPSPCLNLAAVGLVANGVDKLYVGGIPYHLTEIQIKGLLESFGPLRGFNLVKDWETGNSKGYAFCVYQDPAVTDVVCAVLNGSKLCDKTLTVRRRAPEPRLDQLDIVQQGPQQLAIDTLALQAMSAGKFDLSGVMPGDSTGQVAEFPTKVLSLSQLLTVDDLCNDQEYADIYDDVKEECSKFGNVTKLIIPRPEAGGGEVSGVGKVFVEYSDTEGARKAKAVLHQRKFGGNSVIATFYPEDKFERGQLNG